MPSAPNMVMAAFRDGYLQWRLRSLNCDDREQSERRTPAAAAASLSSDPQEKAQRGEPGWSETDRKRGDAAKWS